MSRLSGSTAVPTQPRATGERDSTYVPGNDEDSDDDLYDGPSPSSHRKRPRGEPEIGAEGETPRKSARLEGKRDDGKSPATASSPAHIPLPQAGASSSAAGSPSKPHAVREPAAVLDLEVKREYIYVSSDSENQPKSTSSSPRKKIAKQPRPHTLVSSLDSVLLQSRKTSKGKEPTAKKARSGPPKLPEPALAVSALRWQCVLEALTMRADPAMVRRSTS